MKPIVINDKYSVERPDPFNFKVIHKTKGVGRKEKKKGKTVITERISCFSKLEQALNFVLTNSALDEVSSLQEVLANIQTSKNEILQAVSRSVSRLEK